MYLFRLTLKKKGLNFNHTPVNILIISHKKWFGDVKITTNAGSLVGDWVGY